MRHHPKVMIKILVKMRLANQLPQLQISWMRQINVIILHHLQVEIFPRHLQCITVLLILLLTIVPKLLLLIIVPQLPQHIIVQLLVQHAIVWFKKDRKISQTRKMHEKTFIRREKSAGLRTRYVTYQMPLTYYKTSL